MMISFKQLFDKRKWKNKNLDNRAFRTWSAEKRLPRPILIYQSPIILSLCVSCLQTGYFQALISTIFKRLASSQHKVYEIVKIPLNHDAQCRDRAGIGAHREFVP